MTYTINQKMWVVIPTFNRCQDLLECIGSLHAAGIASRQIIVVDNNSQDETVQQVKEKHTDCILVELDKNLGASGASNIGFKIALAERAEYILRLDSDTIVAPDFAKPLLEAAEKSPQIGILSPKIYYFEQKDEIWYAGVDAHHWHFGAIRGHRHEKDKPENSQEQQVDYIWAAAMLIKREVLQKTGGFDKDFFVYYEEIDFCRRTKALGYQLVYIPNSHIWHKVGSSANNAWTAYQWNRSKILLYRKHAKHIVHRTLLISYALAYIVSADLLSKKFTGNRGPIIHALKGFWAGLTKKIK